MKVKNWFVAFVLSLLLPMAVSAGESTDSYCVVSGLAIDEIPISGVTGTSGAKYAGKIGYDGDYPCFVMDETYVYATTKSPGTAKSVSITWADDEEWYNTDGVSTIYVYGSHSAFDGSETKGDLDAAGISCVGSIVYAGVFGTSALDVSAGSYEFIAIVGGATQAGVECVAVTWTVPDVTLYTLSESHTGTGKITFSPKSPVAAGTTVKVVFKGSKTELHSFSIKKGASVIKEADLDEDEYTTSYSTTFTMPAGNVSVTSAFEAVPSPARVANPISVNGVYSTYDTTLESGADGNIVVATTYNAGTDPAYNRALKSVESLNSNIVEVVGNTYDPATGEGLLTLRGKTTGSTTVAITTYQTNGTLTSTRIINITVTAREAVLITELNGKYYAVKNNPSGATVAGVELFKQGSDYYYKSAGDLSDITWKAENANSAGTKFYFRNSAGKYLTIDAADMSLESETFNWSLNANEKLITNYLTGICYDEKLGVFTVNNQNEFASADFISPCVHEVSASSLHLATEYTRSLTDGNYATMCLPYSVSRSETFFSGVDVYRITGKYMSGDKLTGIEMEEVEDALEAGVPYIILAKASTMSVWHGSNEVEDPASALGLVGNLGVDPIFVPVGCYGISSNQLRRVAYENTAKIGQYKAYIDITDVPNASAGTPSPKRRALYVENASSSTEEEQIATSLEDLLGNMTLINWNEPVYNMLGQRVGKGTTGVLIQNGQKFIVQ